MVCARCGRGIVLVSGKGDGYYSCSAGRLHACENRLRVPRRRAEDIILGSVQQRLGQPAVLRAILERVVAEVEKLCAHVPASFERKTKELEQVRRRVARLVDFIARGRESRAVAEELAVTEHRVEVLEAEVDAMKRARSVVVRAPSLEWLEERIAAFRTVLERRTVESATLLRRLLGKITLEPMQPETGAPYYVARTALDVLVLLDPDGPGPDPDPGARSLRWWRRPVLHLVPHSVWRSRCPPKTARRVDTTAGITARVVVEHRSRENASMARATMVGFGTRKWRDVSVTSRITIRRGNDEIDR